MVYRVCQIGNGQICQCSDVEMQPCLAKVIKTYLEAIWDCEDPAHINGFHWSQRDCVWRQFKAYDSLEDLLEAHRRNEA